MSPDGHKAKGDLQVNIQQPLEAYLRTKAKKSKHTASTYRSGLDGWLEWADEHELEPVTTEAVLGYHTYLVDEMTAATTTTYMAAICGLLEFIEVNGQEHGVNMTRVKYEIRNGPRVYSYNKVAELDDLRKKEMPKLLAHFEQYPIPETNDNYNHRLTALRNVALFWTFYETAARVGEVRRIDRRMIRPDTQKITVKGKGNRSHTLRFGIPEHRAIPAILRYLSERYDNSAAVFVAHSRNSGGKRLSQTSLSTIITKEMRALGIPKPLSAHDIRHWRAATMLKEDMPLHVIQQFLNHKDMGTTRKFYAPITDEEDMMRHLSRLTV